MNFRTHGNTQNERGFYMNHRIRKLASFLCSAALLAVTAMPPALAEGNSGQSIKVTGLSLDQSYALLLFSDSRTETVTLQPRIEPENAADKTVLWTSSNEKAAAVADGVVSVAGSGGTAVITATTEDGGFQATCFVSVVENDSPNVALEKDLAAALSQKGDSVSMDYHSQKLDSSTLERFKAVGKTVALNVKDDLGRSYGWTFDGTALDDIRPSYSYYISVETYENVSGKPFPNDTRLYGFSVRESLPGSPLLTLDVSSVYADNSSLYLYNDGNTLIDDNLTVKNGKVTMPVKTAGAYTLSNQAIAGASSETTVPSAAEPTSPLTGESSAAAATSAVLLAAAACVIGITAKKKHDLAK